MTDLTTLKTAHAAAFAAWKACPDKNRAEKARLAAVLDAAAKAVAAAKKAAEPEKPVIDQAAVLAAWNKKQAANAAQRDIEKRVASAARLYERAHEWPRCGELWPMDSAERAAARLLADHPGLLESLEASTFAVLMGWKRA